MVDNTQISFIGVQFPLSNSLYGYFTPSYDSYQHLKSKIINLLLTTAGERMISQNLQFGTKLNYLIFQPATDTFIQRISSHIVDRISKYIPQVNILDINIEYNQLSFEILVKLKFKLKNDLTGLGQDLILAYSISE